MQGVEADDGARPALRRLAEIGDGEGVVPAGQAGEIVEYFLGRAILVGVDVTGRFDRGAVVDAKGDHAVIGAGAGDDRDTGAVESESCRVPPLRDETVTVLPEAPGSLRRTHEPWYEIAGSRSSTTC